MTAEGVRTCACSSGTPEDLVRAADLELYEQTAARRNREGTNSSQLKLELSW